MSIYWDSTSKEKEEMWFCRRWSMRYIKSHKKKLEKNVFSIYGECVANKVRDLNSPWLQSIIQHKIHTILLEAEMELHNFQIHNQQAQLTVHFDSEHSSWSYTVTSTPTPQSYGSHVSDFQIIATNSSSANGISEFIVLKWNLYMCAVCVHIILLYCV